MKKFSFTKCGSRRYFYQVLWQFLRIAASPLAGEPHQSDRRIFAAEGGKKRSNYFKNRAPARKCQIRLARFGGLGNQIVGNFGRKNQLAVLF